MATEGRMETTASVIRQRIETWMRETIRSGGYRKFVDLHIDQIHPLFTRQEEWISGSLQCLEAAQMLRNRFDWPFIVAIGMSLESGELPRGLTFTTFGELAADLDPSPPSLYLFEKSDSPWQSDSTCRELRNDLHLPGNLPTRSFLQEWWDENDGEFRRTVWIAG
jgi:hypothetical protein